MVQPILIGLAAGSATALLFASVASGSALAIPLFYLAPLPILIAALGWSHWAGLIAALTASAAMAVVFGGLFFLSFLIGVGLPAWWLGYLALLARPTPGTEALEWYPVGHLVFWAALLGGGVVVAAILSLGTDFDTFRATLRGNLERMFASTGAASSATADSEYSKNLFEFLAVALPPAAAVLTTITSLVNLWIAERVVKISGRLRRPPSDLTAMHFPRHAPLLVAAAVAISFFGGMAGLAGGVLSSSLLMAYAILGFAVLHAVTRGMTARPFALGGLYAAVAMFGWPVLALSLLGLADSAFDIRGRAARKRNSIDPRT